MEEFHSVTLHSKKENTGAERPTRQLYYEGGKVFVRKRSVDFMLKFGSILLWEGRVGNPWN